jgi:hypothetical protein
MALSSKTVRGRTADHTPKSQWPVVVGSFLTGVAAMTMVGVTAPTIASARAPQPPLADRASRQMPSTPEALVEITEAEQREMEARLAAADAALEAARAASAVGMARLRNLEGR